MLRPSSRPSLVAGSKPGGNNMDNLDEFDKAYDNLESVQPLGQQKARIANHEEPSLRFWKIRKRSTEEIARELTNPKNSIENAIGVAGYHPQNSYLGTAGGIPKILEGPQQVSGLRRQTSL
mmetsp:Transcript_19250/g.39551  ORF Transcript_19250/g.39551 Transcript_19250/m.39551 type:complete len:121 (+) Transcript_19250:338-700(+)